VYPIIAVIDKLGWRQISDDVLSGIFATLAEEMRTR
jgi:hypothetical protein